MPHRTSVIYAPFAAYLSVRRTQIVTRGGNGMRYRLSLFFIAWSLSLLSACVVMTENVTHGPGLIHYPGYKVDYVEATPKPGTAVTEGARVRFSVTVRYVLQAAEKGDLALVFRDQRGDPILREYGITSEIKRGTGDATLSQEVTIPKGVWDMWLWIPVIPDGVSNPTGILQVRYPVVRPH